MLIIENFDQVIKHNFDQTPKLLQNFDQLIRSSEIRSSDPLSFMCYFKDSMLTKDLSLEIISKFMIQTLLYLKLSGRSNDPLGLHSRRSFVRHRPHHASQDHRHVHHLRHRLLLLCHQVNDHKS